MDKVLTNNAASGQPFLAPTTMDLLQTAYTNVFNQTMLGLIGSTYSASIPYIISGCVATATGFGTDFTEGLVYFNGEVFYSPAQFVTSGVGVLVGSINVTYAAADPITYADGSTHNTHQLRRVVFDQATSGSGTIGDYADFVRINTANIDYTNTATTIGAITVNFDKNKWLTYNNTGSSNTITVNVDTCISGREVTITTGTGTAGHTIDFAVVSGVTIQPVGFAGFPYTLANTRSVTIKMRAVLIAASTWIIFTEILN